MAVPCHIALRIYFPSAPHHITVKLFDCLRRALVTRFSRWKSRGSIHLLFALVNMFQQVMRSHQQLSFSRVLCPESVVSFSEYVISVDVMM